MSQECGRITADLTVGDVAHRCAGAMDIMKKMGINHCCGANLTLREAAASAGVALEVLLEALDRPGAAVR
jgi:iron-sulfur cluster repair protein YtfE (RIC family)